MDIREYLTGMEGRTWHAEDTAWVMDKLRQIDQLAQAAHDAHEAHLAERWRENAAWNARTREEWEARQP